MESWEVHAGQPVAYPPELRESIRRHVTAVMLTDEGRRMGAHMEQEYDRVLSLWLGSKNEHSAHVAHALTVVWLTAAAVTYNYLIEDIIDAVPDKLTDDIGDIVIELEKVIKNSGDYAWAAHVAQEILTRLLDHKDRNLGS